MLAMAIKTLKSKYQSFLIMCPVLLDFFTLLQIFCPGLYIYFEKIEIKLHVLSKTIFKPKKKGNIIIYQMRIITC